MLKQAGEISGGANKNLSSTTTGGAAGVAAVAGGATNTSSGGLGGETSFVQAVLKLKNGTKMGATGSSTLAGTVTAALAQQQSQQPSSLPGGGGQQQQHPLPDINVINVPEYPERASRRVMTGPGKASGGVVLQQPPQQNKGLSAPLADISSSGPNGKTLIFKSRVSLVPLNFVCGCDLLLLSNYTHIHRAHMHKYCHIPCNGKLTENPATMLNTTPTVLAFVTHHPHFNCIPFLFSC